jgi:hypothetical protein
MSNSVTVSFKLPPDHYAVLVALTRLDGSTVSEFVRDTITEHLNLNGISDTFRASVRESESDTPSSESRLVDTPATYETD